MTAGTWELAAGTLFSDRYRIVREIKSGAMGTVYEVVDERTNGRRALKVLKPALLLNPEQRKRFLQEARVTSGIESDHVVRVFDAASEGDVPYLVMELLRGEDLQDLLDRQKKLPEDEVAEYLGQLARVLDKAHAANLVHRDIKPGNVFVSRHDDGWPCVKLLDFGISKVMVTGKADATRVVGTPMYMAPEQIKGDGTIDGRADLYAMAHLAYTLLTGEAYWEAQDDDGRPLILLMKILEGGTEPASKRALRRTGTKLTPGFDRWFAKATARDRAQRFPNAAALVEAFEAVERGAEIGAQSTVIPSIATRPTDVPEATGQFMQRQGLTAHGPTLTPTPSPQAASVVASRASFASQPTVAAPPPLAPTVLHAQPHLTRQLADAAPAPPPRPLPVVEGRSRAAMLAIAGAALLAALAIAFAIYSFLASRTEDSAPRPSGKSARPSSSAAPVRADVSATAGAPPSTPSTSVSTGPSSRRGPVLPPLHDPKGPALVIDTSDCEPEYIACGALRVPTPKATDPALLVGEVRRFARSKGVNEPTRMILFRGPQTAAGLDTTSTDTSVILNFTSARRGVDARLYNGVVSLVVVPGMNTPAVDELAPRCSLQKMVELLRGQNVSPSWSTQFLLIYDGTSSVWAISDPSAYVTIDDGTCTLVPR